jgi:hypothetical protein
MTWKDKSCEKCVFNVDGSCRRFPAFFGIYPPVSKDINEMDFENKTFHLVTKYSLACGEYAESLDKPINGTV